MKNKIQGDRPQRILIETTPAAPVQAATPLTICVTAFVASVASQTAMQPRAAGILGLTQCVSPTQ